jgi:hypothetical protein
MNNLFQNISQDIQFMYAYYGSTILIATISFIIIYGYISYLASTSTTTPAFNMGIPVSDYVGNNYWTTYITQLLVAIPLTVITVWFLVHLINIIFKIDLLYYIKQLLKGNPILPVIEKVDKTMEDAETTAAEFIHSIVERNRSEEEGFTPSPYRGSASSSVVQEEVAAEEPNYTVSSYNPLETYSSVEGIYQDKQDWRKKLN